MMLAIYVCLAFGYTAVYGSFGRSGELSFLEEPTAEQEVNEGETVVLDCKVPPGVVVHWELRGVPLDASPRRFMNGTDLVIAKVLHGEDRGPFTCVISDKRTGSDIASRPAYLNIKWLQEMVTIQKASDDSSTVVGGDLHLTCQVEGTQPLKIQWFRNGDGLLTVENVNTTGRDLVVKGLKPHDNGVYRCLASNDAGTAHSSNRIVVNVPGSQWARIVVVPEDTIAKPGSDVMLNCAYQFVDVIEWYFKQTGPLENSTRFSILPNGSLVVRSVSKAEEGLYLCVGIKADSTEIPQGFSGRLQLAYLKDPDNTTLGPFLDNDSMKIVGKGDTLRMGCFAPDGLPKPTVSWSNGEVGPILTIKKVSKAHEGYYTCIITNIADTKNVTFQLAVTTKPVITLNPTSVTVDEGNNALLQCEFQGSSKFTRLQWVKDNTPLRGHRFVEGQFSLAITNVVPSDEGEYLCQITTKPFLPVYSTPAVITVREKLKFLPKPLNTNLELGTVRKVHCRAQGSVPPSVRWFKGIDNEDNFPDHVSDINGTLYFNKVKLEDKGNYTCVAANTQGVINVTIEIDVVASPKFAILPQNPTEVLEGSPLMLDCVAEGDPLPTIHWDKNSNMKNVDDVRYKTLENGSLYIQEVQTSDEGQYGCTAGNSGGLKRYEVTLIVKGNDGYKMYGDGGEEQDSMLSKTVAVTLGAAGAYMILVIGLMVYCKCRSKRKKQTLQEVDPGSQEAGHSGERAKCNGEAVHSEDDGTVSSQNSQSSSHTYGKLVITRDHLTEMMVLGQGQFGDVCLARVENDDKCGGVVMVKTLLETRDEGVLHEFKRELDLFGRVNHANVVKLVGLCRDQYPHYMVLQYTDWGDLKQMLLATKGERKDKPKPPELTAKIMFSLIKDLCLGMEHISNHRLVHRDLAARNCLVSSNLSVKISLSALSKDVYRKEYFHHRNKLMPVRWIAPEIVSDDDYSTKSDVFSFGVTAWEIFARCDMPHAGCSDQEVVSGLLENGGLQLLHHEGTPQSLISLVNECRAANPSDRPLFSSLVIKIADIIDKLE
ncbi:inactive tyrosine-protein kinase 7-like [Cimex lectularius]|uniref:Receptor protein-tyrosine kinase n=1 Tax=Cimex lectularius TaxID=79782 RepID=A0A8I6RU34_CIMLE|nr:inactive tyrosine-protein kinase 7-like [Cimex lectularius]